MLFFTLWATTFISTHGTTIPKMHQYFSLSFLRSGLDEKAFALFKVFLFVFQNVCMCMLK